MFEFGENLDDEHSDIGSTTREVTQITRSSTSFLASVSQLYKWLGYLLFELCLMTNLYLR
jgi:hypothetical protein